MRRITIKRQASIKGFFRSICLYVEDAEGTEELCSVRCRKLFNIKNGEERSFEIGEDEVRIFAVTGGANGESTVTEYPIAAGNYALFIGAKCLKIGKTVKLKFMFCLTVSNRFSLDRARAKRKKIIIASVIALCLAIAVFLGFQLKSWLIPTSMRPKDFEIEEMTITLTKGFVVDEREENNCTKAFISRDCWVCVIREGYDENPSLEDVSVYEYCEMIKRANGNTVSTIETKDELTYFVFESHVPQAKRTYTYYLFAYKSDNAMWFIQFATTKQDVEEWKDYFFEWAESVSFD